MVTAITSVILRIEFTVCISRGLPGKSIIMPFRSHSNHAAVTLLDTCLPYCYLHFIVP